MVSPKRTHVHTLFYCGWKGGWIQEFHLLDILNLHLVYYRSKCFAMYDMLFASHCRKGTRFFLKGMAKLSPTQGALLRLHNPASQVKGCGTCQPLAAMCKVRLEAQLCVVAIVALF